MMHSPEEEGETPVKVLTNIRSTISCLQRLESSIVRQQQQQQQPKSVSSTSTQTEKEVPPLGTKPDVSYYRQSKLMAQYQELAGADGVLRQVVSEVVSSEEVQTSTLAGTSTVREAEILSSPSPSPQPSLAPISLPSIPSSKPSPPQATSPISPSPCATSKFTEKVTPPVIGAACSSRSSGSDGQITVPQFLIYSSSRSLSQSTNVTSFESTDSGLAGESFEAYSPEPPLTIDLGPDIVSAPQAIPIPLPQSNPPAEASPKEQVRRSLKQLVTGNLAAATSSTMMHLNVEPSTDSEVARLLQSTTTSTTFSSSTQKRRESIIEELPEHYKRLRASSSTLEQLKILQLQKSSLEAASVVMTARGSKVAGQSCGGGLSDQTGFAWPPVPLPPPPPSPTVDARKGQLRRQETIIGDAKGHLTWATSPLQPPQPSTSSTAPPDSARSPCRQASCRACGPAFLEQQLHWQRSSRSNSLPVHSGPALVDPALNVLRRASVPVSVTGIPQGQASTAAVSSAQYRRGSSHQILSGLALTSTSNLSSQAAAAAAAAASQLHHQSIQHHQAGLQTHTIYYNTEHQQHQHQHHHHHHHHQQTLPSMTVSMAPPPPSSLGSSPAQPSVSLPSRPFSTLVHHHPHQQQQHQQQYQQHRSSPATSQHSHGSTSAPSSQSSVGGVICSAGGSVQAAPTANVHSSLPLPCIVTGCHQILANQVALAEHLQVKHNQPLYWCCGASYTMSAFLQEHIHRRHRSDPICQLCGRLFPQAKSLWDHLNSTQCDQLVAGEQTRAAAGAGTPAAAAQRYVKCNWIGCGWSGVDHQRHYQRVHLRLMNKYTRLEGIPQAQHPPPPPPGSSGDGPQCTSGI